MLVVVEDRDQDVEVLEQIVESDGRRQCDSVIGAGSPLRVEGVELMAGRLDLIAERLEQSADQRLAAAARHSRERRLQRKGSLHRLRSIVAPAGHRRAIDLRNGDAEKGGGDVWPI